MHEFESWAGVQADRGMQFDWDDALGNAARREAGLRLEKMRNVSARCVLSWLGRSTTQGCLNCGASWRQACKPPLEYKSRKPCACALPALPAG